VAADNFICVKTRRERRVQRRKGDTEKMIATFTRSGGKLKTGIAAELENRTRTVGAKENLGEQIGIKREFKGSRTKGSRQVWGRDTNLRDL